jgi:hypothetical protein
MTNKTLLYILGGAVLYYYGYKYYQKNKPKIGTNGLPIGTDIQTDIPIKNQTEINLMF